MDVHCKISVLKAVGYVLHLKIRSVKLTFICNASILATTSMETNMSFNCIFSRCKFDKKPQFIKSLVFELN